MAQQESTEVRIGRIRRQVEAWRRLGRRGTAMPEGIWTAAVEVAQEIGVYAASQRIGVAYNSLKTRLEACPRQGARALVAGNPRRAEPAFVDVGPAAAFVTSGWDSEIEVVSGSGERVTIRLARGAAVDAVDVVRALRDNR